MASPDGIVAASNGTDLCKMQQIQGWSQRASRAPTDGDDVDLKLAWTRAQGRGQQQQRALQAIQSGAVDKAFWGRVIGPGFDLHCDPGAATADEQVQFGCTGPEILRFDAVASLTQGAGGDGFAAPP